MLIDVHAHFKRYGKRLAGIDEYLQRTPMIGEAEERK
jgi:hypothetical protein